MIILFGVVGSGKSEQGRRLLAKLNCPYISTSQLLQDHLTPQRQQAMQAGKLVNDEDIFSLLGPALDQAHADKSDCILDGAPRSIGQAKWLDAKIKDGQVKLTAIIHINVTKKALIKRLKARQRQDDQDEIIEQRYKVYQEITAPVLDYLRQQGYKIDEIQGEQPPDKVEQDIQKALGL